MDNLNERMHSVQRFFSDRGIKQYGAVIVAMRPDMQQHVDEIRRLVSSRTQCLPKYEPLLVAMEDVVERLKVE